MIIINNGFMLSSFINNCNATSLGFSLSDFMFLSVWKYVLSAMDVDWELIHLSLEVFVLYNN